MKKIICLAVFFINVLLLTSCSGNNANGISSATSSRYQKIEIRDYKGTKLDPSIGPRDNSIKGVQYVDIKTYKLKVSGMVENPVSLSYSDVTSLSSYEKLVILYCVEGWDATILWKGALITDIIDKAKVKSTADTVVFHCVDGYTTSLPLQYIKDKSIIVAYSSNGIALPSQLGYPFIVVAEDKVGYKWARWVDEIELSDDPNYKGYWESHGYSNDANIK
ncbi:MAG: molybdopterin-dependent oxidoreductase [Clostridiaceae bacterium]